MTRPAAGDELAIARKDGAVAEAWQRTAGGKWTNITGDVGGVESTSESIHVSGKRFFPTVEPWQVSCDRDPECTDDLLRGTVRAAGLDWHSECRSVIEASMSRYHLTEREREVATALLTPWTAAGLAEELDIAVSTMAKHTQSVAKRMGVRVDFGYDTRTGIILKLLDLEDL